VLADRLQDLAMRPTADNIRQGECDATVGAAGRHGRSIGS